MLELQSEISAMTLEDQEFIARLKNLDLDPIIFRVMHNEETLWTLEQADYAAQLYRGFLYLAWKYPNKAIVPNKIVDQFWHQHILDTAKYREDCQMVFGYFLEHFPYFGMRGEEDKQNLETAFEETMSLFTEHFTQIASPADKASDCLFLTKSSDCLFATQQTKASDCLFAAKPSDCLFVNKQMKASDCLFAAKPSDCLFGDKSKSPDTQSSDCLFVNKLAVDMSRPRPVRI